MRSAAAIGSATSVPTVPGTIGERPAPNPSAMKCAGCDTRNLSDGARRIGFKGLSAEMIEGRRRRRERLSALVSHDELAAWIDAANAGEGQRELPRELLKRRFGARWRGEAELVVIPAGKETFERQRALGAREPAIERRGSWQRRELDRRADARGFEDVSEIAGEPVGDVDGRAREPAQALAERDSRGRTQQCMLAMSEFIGCERDEAPVMRERERGITEPTGDKDRIAGPRAAALERLPRRSFAEDRDAQA